LFDVKFTVPDTAEVGAVIQVCWDIQQGQANEADQIRMYVVGGAWYDYLGSQATAAARKGCAPFTIPVNAGPLEFRYQQAGGLKAVAGTSPPVTTRAN